MLGLNGEEELEFHALYGFLLVNVGDKDLEDWIRLQKPFFSSNHPDHIIHVMKEIKEIEERLPFTLRRDLESFLFTLLRMEKYNRTLVSATSPA